MYYTFLNMHFMSYFYFQIVTNLKNTLSDFKRFIGRKFDDPVVQAELKRHPFKAIKQSNGGIGFEVSLSSHSSDVRDIHSKPSNNPMEELDLR